MDDLVRWLTLFIVNRTPLEYEGAAVVARIASVVVAAALLFVAYRIALAVLRRPFGLHRDAMGTARHRTLRSILTNLVHWTFAFTLLGVLLRGLGLDPASLLVSAGVVGLAVGFGAQTLIKDLITGAFILFENLLAVGDVVEFGGKTGTVESIGLRVTTFRTEEGALRVVPNGSLTDFVNMSRGAARAIVDVAVPPGVDVGRALDVLGQVGQAWASESDADVEAPRTEGIVRFSGDNAVVRLVASVQPERRAEAEAELRRRVREAFERQRWPVRGAA